MSSRKTVTHIITGLNVGGAERALHTLLTGGLYDEFDSHVISLTDEGYYGQILCEAGILVTCLAMSSGRVNLKSLWRLRKAMKTNQPDILQGWMYHGNIAAVIARFFVPKRVKLVWNIRTSVDDYSELSLSRRVIIRLGSILSNKTDVILFNSKRSFKQHVDLGYFAKKMITVPNGFDTNIWRPSKKINRQTRNNLGFYQDDLIIRFVGRNDTQKDPKNFFLAIENVMNVNINVKAIVIGKGLECVINKKKAKEIIFLGHCDKVSQIMPVFDILCLSSSVEGFPNVIGEAMACGVPCVTTNVGDAAEIVGDTGWVVKPGDSQALSWALQESLLVSQAERDARGRKARLKIINKYSISSTVDNYIEIYNNLLGVK